MRRAEPLAGLGGLALFASLFLDWYRPEAEVPAQGIGGNLAAPMLAESLGGGPENAWGYFSVIDVAIALYALLAFAVPVVSLLAKGPAKPIGTAVLASALGPLAILLVAYRLLFPPFDGVEMGLGGSVAIFAAIIAWVGSWLSLRDESTPGATLPLIPRLPVP